VDDESEFAYFITPLNLGLMNLIKLLFGIACVEPIRYHINTDKVRLLISLVASMQILIGTLNFVLLVIVSAGAFKAPMTLIEYFIQHFEPIHTRMSSVLTPSAISPHSIGGSLCNITADVSELASPIFQVESAGRKREMQTYMVGGSSCYTSWLALTLLL
jgi:hypothetical protein